MLSTTLKRSKLLILTALSSFSLAVPQVSFAADQVVNLYSARQEALIRPLLDKFTAKSGIKVNVVSGKSKALLKRLEAEGRNSPADLLITVDAGNLYAAQRESLFQAIESETLNSNIPQHLRSTENQWFGLSQRSRVIIYAKDRVTPDEISNYADLADPKWKNKICVRSSNNIYNQSLMSAMISHHGQQKAEAWAKDVVENFARAPKGNDRAQIIAVASGQCDLAVVNTYYLGKMETNQKEPEQREAAGKVKVLFPDQDSVGAHMNISGAGVTAHAQNKDNAVKLLEYLSGDEAQAWYAKINFEYPVNPKISPSELVQGWGYPFKQDQLPISTLGKLNPEAVKTFDRAGWH